MRLFHLNHSLFALSLLALSLLTLGGCNTDAPKATVEPAADQPTTEQPDEASTADKQAGEDPAADQNSAIAETKDRPKPILPAIAPGTYCYQTNEKDKDLYARITVNSNDRVTGNFQGVIHNDEQAYYTSYRQTLDGTIDGSNLNLDIATWIEFDKQNSQETWKVTSKSLSTERDTLGLESCNQVKTVFETNGFEASDLTEVAGRVREIEVFFDAGKSETTVSNAVVRGDRDLYTLSAQGGQQMELFISAVEDNAAFDVISPSGTILTREAIKESLYLPETGQYEIVVGGTRGNASYDLEIAIN